jgi:hypothetical protein
LNAATEFSRHFKNLLEAFSGSFEGLSKAIRPYRALPGLVNFIRPYEAL